MSISLRTNSLICKKLSLLPNQYIRNPKNSLWDQNWRYLYKRYYLAHISTPRLYKLVVKTIKVFRKSADEIYNIFYLNLILKNF